MMETHFHSIGYHYSTVRPICQAKSPPRLPSTVYRLPFPAYHLPAPSGSSLVTRHLSLYLEILQHPHVAIYRQARQCQMAAVGRRDAPRPRTSYKPLLPEDLGTPFQIDMKQHGA
jgi:hypothetical protein